MASIDLKKSADPLQAQDIPFHFSEQGMVFSPYYSTPGMHPFDELKWELRNATIGNEKGEVIFEQKDVEVPTSWSQQATNVVVSKYFHGQLGSPERESSVRQLIGRVADTISRWGMEQGYFASFEDGKTFHAELVSILVNQRAAFNSPVWFNVGCEPKPQCSACFINSVEDNMESILTLAKTEGMLFKWGSGTGTNLSSLRSSKEPLSGGGSASGPVSFMRGYDSFAGVIKSGGKTRRAAKMVILNIDHPDVVEFIDCKASEEKKAWALIEAGYDGGFNVPGGAYDSIYFQNANHSVRVTDEFMQAAVEDREWHTRAVTDGSIVETYSAREMLMRISEGTWICGDPGMQYDTTINRWHTSKASGRINASNPCSEYMYLDDTACNLASINLMKYYDNGTFDVEAFRHTVRVLITAQEIVVDKASYPTPAIEANSHRYRTLGLGYGNLGALLMAQGLPYDGDTGRHYAAAITALMTGEAYAVSSEIAAVVGPFAGYEPNREHMLEVIRMHRESMKDVQVQPQHQAVSVAAQKSWDKALASGESHGYRNAQVTVLAPTGTIAFLMDCDTTGVEPDIALIKYKRLVGGGSMKIVNQTVPLALENLGYSEEEISAILEYLNENETIEGAPELREEHLPVFDCAFKPLKGSRSIHYMGHIRMMGAVQPFITGAISKTVNMPAEVSVEDIFNAYVEAWKLGVKAVAIYRDGSKRTQPLSTSKGGEEKKEAAVSGGPQRRRLPSERHALTHKFSIAGHEGYVTVGTYEDGSPGEIFITMAKEGSVISGLMDSFATTVSLALQYGVPVKVLVDKFSHTRFEPSGFTGNKEIPFAKSIMDYIFRWLALRFLPAEEAQSVHTSTDAAVETKKKIEVKSGPVQSPGGNGSSMLNGKQVILDSQQKSFSFQNSSDAPPCMTCGSAAMVRNGACYKCLNCGATSGCS
ncbi:MAG: vitamin B12-dependent ribonucleotide reductase [Candidatus Sericytochromatia bacterium]|nr:vitamin B12-dependent ribonucleotide reductase [Candidatus Sericytochromatia bacterium]